MRDALIGLNAWNACAELILLEAPSPVPQPYEVTPTRSLMHPTIPRSRSLWRWNVFSAYGFIGLKTALSKPVRLGCAAGYR